MLSDFFAPLTVAVVNASTFLPAAQHLFLLVGNFLFTATPEVLGRTFVSVTVVVDEVLAGSSCGAAACGPSSDSWPLEPIMKSITFKSLAVSVLPILVVKVVHQFCLVPAV